MKRLTEEAIFELVLEEYEGDLIDEDHPSILISNNQFQLLFARYLRYSKEGLSSASRTFLFIHEDVYHYEKVSQKFLKLKDGFKGLANYLYDIYETNRSIYFEYAEEIDNLEDFLYERNIPRHYMDLWFDLKKGITKIDRHYQRSLYVIKDVMKKNQDFASFPARDFDEIYETLNLSASNIQGQLTKLDNIHHYHASIKNDRLNNNIYILTVLSGIFLPLNLIVGFFGMNTENLLLDGNPRGTEIVIYTLAGIIAFILIGFKVLKFLDNYFLRFFFGKYKFYDRLTKKLGEADDVFKFNL